MGNFSWKSLWLKIQKSKYLQIGLILFSVGVLLLVFTAETENKSTETTVDCEQQLSDILEKIEGVGKTEIMIYREDDAIRGVIVLCEGGNDPTTKIIVRQAVSTTLQIDKEKIRIYAKKTE